MRISRVLYNAASIHFVLGAIVFIVGALRPVSVETMLTGIGLMLIGNSLRHYAFDVLRGEES